MNDLMDSLSRVDSSRIRSVESLDTHRLPLLRVLVLDHNLIDDLAGLANLTELRTLHVNHNRIVELDNEGKEEVGGGGCS